MDTKMKSKAYNRTDANAALFEIIVMASESIDRDKWIRFTVESLDCMTEDEAIECLNDSEHKKLIKSGTNNIDELTNNILEWHADRKITSNGNSLTQSVKLGEEFGELCAGIVKNNTTLIKDSIGDMYVVMCAIAKLEGTTIEECISHAYEEIKDRKGYLNSLGNFIKEEES